MTSRFAHATSVALVLAFAAFACSSPAPTTTIDPTITGSKYDQSCVRDSDCVVVAVGDVCPCCGSGEWAAINVAAVAQYQADAGELRKGCPARPVCNASCTSGPQAACVAKACVVRTAISPDASADAAGE